MAPYTWTFARAAGVSFQGLSTARRISLLGDLDRLASHPFRDGHLRYTDTDTREIRVWVVEDLMIHYWLDHAVREVRITQIEPAESP